MSATAADTALDTSSLPVWDLSDLYTGITDSAIEADFDWIDQQSEQFHTTYRGKIADADGDTLAQAIQQFEAIEERLGKIASYAQLLYAADMATVDHGIFYQNTMESINDFSSRLLFFTLELNRISDKHLETEQKDCPELAHYAPWLRDVRAYRSYQLDDTLEELLHDKSVTGAQAWIRLFDETQTDMRFDFNGESLTSAEIFNYLSSPEANTRKKAAKSIGATLEKHSKVLTLITNVLAKDKSIEDKWRKFSRPISSRNVSNLIEDEVVDALLQSVKDSYPKLSHRYYKQKAEWLGKDTLPYWDRNAPLPMQDDRIIPWNEAVDTVLKAYRDFSPQMAAVGQQFFDNNWIDVPPRQGKDSGAFAHPTVPCSHPYLLLNYQGKVRDVMTLAHELGHGVHQYLSGKQGALMADTPLTLAETASVFGEQLTFRSLLSQQTDPEKRKGMIATKVEDMLNTVVRQVAFCEFERQVHDERRNGELSTERLGEIWMGIQQESLGDVFTYDPEYSYYWSYIPHFIHSPFYVYAYAFGDCLVNSLYAVYQQQPQGFEAKYITMLEAGGTLHHKDLLSPFGLDATAPSFWQQGLDSIAALIDEL